MEGKFLIHDFNASRTEAHQSNLQHQKNRGLDLVRGGGGRFYLS